MKSAHRNERWNVLDTDHAYLGEVRQFRWIGSTFLDVFWSRTMTWGLIIYTDKVVEHNSPTNLLMFWCGTELQKRYLYLQGINSKIPWNKGNVCSAKWVDNESCWTCGKLCSKAMNKLTNLLSAISVGLCYILEVFAINFLLQDNSTALLSFNRKYSGTETAGSLCA